MIRAQVGRLLTPERRTILSNSWYLVATTVATSGLGFAYWWLAARRFSPQQVGLAAAAVSAMTLLGYVGMLGFGTLLIGEIHRRGERAMAYIATGIAVSCAAGAALGLGAVFLAPAVSPELADFARDLAAAILFTAGVGLTAASLVADQALIGLLRSGTQFLRNAVFAGAKLILLGVAAIVLGRASSVTIFGTWVVGLLGSMILIGAIALRHESRLARYRPDLEVVRHLGRGMLQHHALNMAVQAPILSLPVVVAAVLSATAAGYFYAAWMMASFVAVATPALGITLYAVGTRSPRGLAHSMRMTLTVSFFLAGAGSLTAIVAGRVLLSTFGKAYAAEASEALIALTLATLPAIIKTHYIQIQRIRGRVGTAAVVVAGAAVLELSGAMLGARRGGLVGLSEGYLAATLLEAVAMSPPVLRAADLWLRPGGRQPVAIPLAGASDDELRADGAG